LLHYVDRPFRAAGKLTFVAIILGAFGSLTGVYVQYTTWREEKNIARYNEDLKNSIATLSELSGTLSAIMNLQQLLFYNFQDALEANVEADQSSFSFKNAILMHLWGRQKFSSICRLIQTARYRNHQTLLAIRWTLAPRIGVFSAMLISTAENNYPFRFPKKLF